MQKSALCTIRLPKSLKDRILAESKARNVSVSCHVRDILNSSHPKDMFSEIEIIREKLDDLFAAVEKLKRG